MINPKSGVIIFTTGSPVQPGLKSLSDASSHSMALVPAISWHVTKNTGSKLQREAYYRHVSNFAAL